MAHNVKYRCTHKTDTTGAESTHIIEVLKKDYTGNVIEVLGTDDIFYHDYELIDWSNPLKDPIKKSRLEFTLDVDDPAKAGYDGEAILQEIYGADEDEYQMRRIIDGEVVWTGSVLTDLLEYDEGPYPYAAKITSKDLSRATGPKYPLTTGRETVVKILTDLLSYTGLDLPIYTYTSWTCGGVSSTDDILNQLYHDRYGLRNYADNGDEQDQRITIEEAIIKMLRNYGLILRQDDGAWRLYQLTAFKNPGSVKEYEYNSAGVQQTSSTIDVTQDVDRQVRYLLPTSNNMFNAALKRFRVRYDHRTTVSNIQFPDRVTIQAADGIETYTQYFQSDGNQSIDLSFKIEALFDAPATPTVGRFLIKVGPYYWSISGQEWTTSFTLNEVELTQGLNTPDGETYFFSNININTSDLPADADNDITVSLYHGHDNNDTKATFTYFSDFGYRINNPSVEEGNNTAIEYELEQSGAYSRNYDHGDCWYGQGPTAYSRAAISTDAAGDNLPVDTFKRVGESTGVNLFELLGREVMDINRSTSRNIQGQMWGEYRTSKMIGYDSSALFFLGGALTGRENIWDGHFLEINVETAADDTFGIFYKKSETSSSSSSGGTGGTGGSVAWLDIQGNPFSSYTADDFLKPSDDAVITGGWSFNQQYTDIGQGFEGSNFGIRGPQQGAGDVYLLFNAATSRWGSKTGAAGNFHRFIQDNDNPTFAGAQFTDTVEGTDGEFTGNLTAYTQGDPAESQSSIYSIAVLNLSDVGQDAAQLNYKGTPLFVSGGINPNLVNGGTATSVDWDDVNNKPGFATVATSGSYNDLLNKPDLSALNEIDFYASESAFPATGETDVVYLASDTGYMYRWNGTDYTQLTDQTAIWGQISGDINNQTDLVNTFYKQGDDLIANSIIAGNTVTAGAEIHRLTGRTRFDGPTADGDILLDMRLDTGRAFYVEQVNTGAATAMQFRTSEDFFFKSDQWRYYDNTGSLKLLMSDSLLRFYDSLTVSGDVDASGAVYADGNVVAYTDGTPAGSSGGTYAASVLNLSTGDMQINRDGVPLYNADGTINSSLITGGTATEVAWTDVTGKPLDSSDISNWDTAFGWGDHSQQGYFVEDSRWNRNDWYLDTWASGTPTNKGFRLVWTDPASTSGQEIFQIIGSGGAGVDVDIADGKLDVAGGITSGGHNVVHEGNFNSILDNTYYQAGDSPSFSFLNISNALYLNSPNGARAFIQSIDNGADAMYLLKLHNSASGTPTYLPYEERWYDGSGYRSLKVENGNFLYRDYVVLTANNFGTYLDSTYYQSGDNATLSGLTLNDGTDVATFTPASIGFNRSNGYLTNAGGGLWISTSNADDIFFRTSDSIRMRIFGNGLAEFYAGVRMSSVLDFDQYEMQNVRDIYSETDGRILLRIQGAAGYAGIYDNVNTQYVLRYDNGSDLEFNPIGNTNFLGKARFLDTVELSHLWSNTSLSQNSFYSSDGSTGFAFGVGTGVSTWFSWDSTNGVQQAIDVFNDGSAIYLGQGGANVRVFNTLTVNDNAFIDGDLNVLGGDIQSGNASGDRAFYRYYGVEFDRATSYLRPFGGNGNSLFIGSGSNRWNDLRIFINDSSGTHRMRMYSSGVTEFTDDLTSQGEIKATGNITAYAS